ncbi:MAG: hypothetical protein ACREF3_07610 [Acetobacteraceae bacterium]
MEVADIRVRVFRTTSRHGRDSDSPVQANRRWYECGLLHPFLDYDEVPAHLNTLPDPMDADGFVHLSAHPGLGDDLDFDYIAANLV